MRLQWRNHHEHGGSQDGRYHSGEPAGGRDAGLGGRPAAPEKEAVVTQTQYNKRTAVALAAVRDFC